VPDVVWSSGSIAMQRAEDLVGEAVHGGAIAKAEARFGRPADGWLDLSTGINPWPYPVPALPPETWRRLPDSDALDALTEAARAGYGVPDEAAVVAAAGSQALIQVLPRLLRPAQVVVVGQM
jgi:cobalamin biosynthesis protein CobC